ncbi:MAG: hypothetical protein ACOVSW_20045 [Candidatus Kapaibacteriota bacterium]|jgi:hypothetical protein
MKNLIYYGCSFLLVCIVIASCSSNNLGSNSNDIIDITSNIQSIHKNVDGSLTMSSVIIPPDPTLSDEKRRKLFRDYLETPEDYVIKKFARDATKMESWSQVHGAAQECINKTAQGYYAFYAHQLIATTMLNTYFLLQKPTPDVQKAVGYYMDILVKYQNYADPNLKSAMLSILIGYWSPDKIAEVAQKNYDHSVYNLTTENFLRDFYPNKLRKASPEQYAQMSSTQLSSRIQDELEAKISSFPKRTKPFPNPMKNWEEYQQCTKESPESIAILALLAQGMTNQNKNR